MQCRIHEAVCARDVHQPRIIAVIVSRIAVGLLDCEARIQHVITRPIWRVPLWANWSARDRTCFFFSFFGDVDPCDEPPQLHSEPRPRDSKTMQNRRRSAAAGVRAERTRSGTRKTTKRGASCWNDELARMVRTLVAITGWRFMRHTRERGSASEG